MLTPTMIVMALQEPDFETYDLSSLRQLIYGSSPMAAEWIQKMLAQFRNVEIVQGYGLTETAPILTLLHMAEHVQAVESGDGTILKSAGRQVPGVDMRIVDAEYRDGAVWSARTARPAWASCSARPTT